MSLELPFGIKVLNPKPVVSRLYNLSGSPYASIGEVLSENTATRYQGELYIVNNGLGSVDIYWFKDGVADLDLIIFGGSNDYLALDGSEVMIGTLRSKNIEATGSVITTELIRVGEGNAFPQIQFGAAASVPSIFTDNAGLELNVRIGITDVARFREDTFVVEGNIEAGRASFSDAAQSNHVPAIDDDLTNKKYVDDQITVVSQTFITEAYYKDLSGLTSIVTGRDFTDDTDAGVNGMVQGQVYHTNGVLKIKL